MAKTTTDEHIRRITEGKAAVTVYIDAEDNVHAAAWGEAPMLAEVAASVADRFYRDYAGEGPLAGPVDLLPEGTDVDAITGESTVPVVLNVPARPMLEEQFSAEDLLGIAQARSVELKWTSIDGEETTKRWGTDGFGKAWGALGVDHPAYDAGSDQPQES